MAPPSTATPTLRSLAERPARTTRAAAKTISQVIPSIIVPAAADPAVFVKLHGDLRLSLHALAKKTGLSFADSYIVTSLATGFIELSPGESASEPLIDEPDLVDPLRVDSRMRLRMTLGVQKRLAVPVGGEVLVTCRSDDRSIRLINLGTLANVFIDSLEVRDTTTAEGEVTTPSHRSDRA